MSLARVASSTSMSSSLASSPLSSLARVLVGSFTFSLKLLKPIPMFFGRSVVSSARVIPLAPLPKPSPFLYPIFSKSFIPIPFVCFSNDPTSFALLFTPLPPPLLELVPANASVFSRLRARAAFSSAARFAFACLRSSSAIFARCAAPATSLCPNVDGNKSSSSSSSSSSTRLLSSSSLDDTAPRAPRPTLIVSPPIIVDPFENPAYPNPPPALRPEAVASVASAVESFPRTNPSPPPPTPAVDAARVKPIGAL
mmetsp:Transcript_5941/g.21444  ORF Transcript_5941/g.21444 Transcript_5941/m.21444 type:complete len:254 (-) Transcript_5941:226-987(-)